MKNKRQFLTKVATAVISGLMVAGMVMAVTTISANIVTQGTLSVTSTATSGNLALITLDAAAVTADTQGLTIDMSPITGGANFDEAGLVILGDADVTGTGYGMGIALSGTMDFGITLSAATINTADIVLSNSATIHNSTAGQVDVGVLSSPAGGAYGLYAVNTLAAATDLTGEIVGGRFAANSNAGDTSASGSVKGVMSQARARLPAGTAGAGVFELTAFYGSADAKNSADVAYLRGIEVSLDGLAGSTATLAQGVLISNNSSGTQTTSYALDINSGTASEHKVFTRDIRLQNGATISNGALIDGWYPSGGAGLEFVINADTGDTVLQGVYLMADANGVDVTTMRGMEISLDGNNSENITTLIGLRIADNFQTNHTATSYGLQFYADSFAYTADIQLSGGAGALSNRPMIMSGAGAPAAGRCVATNLGSIYLNTSGGVDTSVYVCVAAGDWNILEDT